MSLAETKKAVSHEQPELRLATEPRGWFDQKLAWLSEFISPILVKETRQSFKSRQFSWTFFLLLGATAIWSILGYSLTVNQSEFPGQFLLAGYWVILGFPLAIIIPFSVFRSLASEYENNTIQLVSITTMRPRQIVFGKVGSAVLQMLVFFSVLSPCICFTYLLRGVDLMQIGFGLGISFFGSLGLCMIGLFLAGISQSNVFRIALSVGFMFGLFMTYFGFVSLMGSLNQGYGLGSEALFPLLCAMCALFFGIGFLAYSAAAAQISFPADNRSTLIRVSMLVANVVTVSLFGLALSGPVYYLYLWSWHMTICHLWLVFGVMMCGENPFMSPRVRRSLPDSLVGRSFLNFLMPGPGRGYLFALINLLGWTFVLLLVTWFGESLFELTTFWGRVAVGPRKVEVTRGIIVNLIYSALFLSLTFWVVHVAQKRRVYLTPVSSLLIGILIAGGFLLMAIMLHYGLVPARYVSDYSNWQMLNWYWTSWVWVDEFSDANVVGMVVFALLSLVFTGMSVFAAIPELLRKRSAVPQRVLQDIEQNQIDYVPPSETIDQIFDNRLSEREEQP